MYLWHCVESGSTIRTSESKSVSQGLSGLQWSHLTQTLASALSPTRARLFGQEEDFVYKHAGALHCGIAGSQARGGIGCPWHQAVLDFKAVAFALKSAHSAKLPGSKLNQRPHSCILRTVGRSHRAPRMHCSPID